MNCFRFTFRVFRVLFAFFALPSFNQKAVNSSYRRFIRARLAFVVNPSDFHLIARLAAFKRELSERVLRHRWPPLGAEDGFAGMLGFDGLDEPSGHEFAIGGAALAGFHFVAHEHANGGFVALHLGTDAHGIC
jgi:hypothetical protein